MWHVAFILLCRVNNDVIIFSFSGGFHLWSSNSKDSDQQPPPVSNSSVIISS